MTWMEIRKNVLISQIRVYVVYQYNRNDGNRLLDVVIVTFGHQIKPLSVFA